MSDLVILCDQLYDGISSSLRENQKITVRDGKILSVSTISDDDLSKPVSIHVPIASPGMIDIQINGAADTQFNFTPTAEAIEKISWGARQGGTTHILPTFITAHGKVYLQAIAAARQSIQNGISGIIGIHLEGPFLSPARPGIHDPSAIRPLEEDDVVALEREARDFPGIILLTIAPECQKPSYLKRLSTSGIILFAGHSEAAMADLTYIQGVTHLWNAMPAPTSRNPGLISEVLGGDRLYAGIIADGFHVGEHALKMSIRAAADRLCLVTDAMMTLAGSATGFDLSGRYISLNNDRLTSAGGTLAGAHIAMDISLQNVMRLADIDLLTALKMATYNPACALGLNNNLGCIEAGHMASISFFDENLNSTGVTVNGKLMLRSI